MVQKVSAYLDVSTSGFVNEIFCIFFSSKMRKLVVRTLRTKLDNRIATYTIKHGVNIHADKKLCTKMHESKKRGKHDKKLYCTQRPLDSYFFPGA